MVLAGIAAMAMTLANRTPQPPRSEVVVPAQATSRTSASLVPAFTEDGNLLRDPSFEIDMNSDGVADAWTQFGAAAEFTLEPSARYGNLAQRIAMQGVADPIANYAGVQQYVTLPGDGSYILSVDYRHVLFGAPDPSRGVGITVYALAGDDSYIASGTTADWGWPTTESWSRRSIRVRPPLGAAKLIVEFRMSVNGILWLDGAKLQRAAAG
jgi:hypothetical protein